MIPQPVAFVTFCCLVLVGRVWSFVPGSPTTQRIPSRDALHGSSHDWLRDRRGVMSSLAGIMTFGFPWSANALIKGNPPPGKALSEEYRQGTAALGNTEEAAPIPREAYKKSSSGLVYADIRSGSGSEVAREGSRVNLQWVLRKGNGYFVDSSESNDSIPFIFTIGDGKAIAGVDEGVRGMKAGGVRRLLIPVKMAYVDGLEDDKAGPVPNGFGPKQQMRRVQNVRKDVPGEYVFLEVQLTRMR